ncbi:hypothetical protein [Clostridium thermopalmarium]|nr:hypothetical protein [Clostridium thermopalmarium]
MGAYMATRIMAGVYTYDYVISKRPDLKESIDAYLISKGREDLITE